MNLQWKQLAAFALVVVASMLGVLHLSSNLDAATRANAKKAAQVLYVSQIALCRTGNANKVKLNTELQALPATSQNLIKLAQTIAATRKVEAQVWGSLLNMGKPPAGPPSAVRTYRHVHMIFSRLLARYRDASLADNQIAVIESQVHETPLAPVNCLAAYHRP